MHIFFIAYQNSPTKGEVSVGEVAHFWQCVQGHSRYATAIRGLIFLLIRNKRTSTMLMGGAINVSSTAGSGQSFHQSCISSRKEGASVRELLSYYDSDPVHTSTIVCNEVWWAGSHNQGYVKRAGGTSLPELSVTTTRRLLACSSIGGPQWTPSIIGLSKEGLETDFPKEGVGGSAMRSFAVGWRL